jgi:hypothetical protein
MGGAAAKQKTFVGWSQRPGGNGNGAPCVVGPDEPMERSSNGRPEQLCRVGLVR